MPDGPAVREHRRVQATAPEGQGPARPRPGREAADLRHRRGARRRRTRPRSRRSSTQDPREELRLPHAGPRDRAEQAVSDTSDIGSHDRSTDEPTGSTPTQHEDFPMNLTRRNFPPRRRRLAGPAAARRASPRAAAPAAKPPRRMVCINTPLGLHPAAFFPEKAGKDYALSPYLEVAQGLPRRLHGHLRAVAPGRRPEPRLQLQLPDRRPAPGAAGRLQEQHLARPVRGRAHRRPDAVRQPAAVVRGLRPVVDPQRRARADGVLAVERVRQAVPRRPARRGRRPRRAACADGQSILDAVREQAERCRPRLGAGDRDKLDEYFTSVRELEQRLATVRGSGRRSPSRRSTPSRRRTSTNSTDLIGKTRLWFDLIHLALQTDSTRLVTLQLLGTSGVPPIPGVSLGHHDLSHHGQDPTKIAQLKKLETREDEDPARLPQAS